MNTRRIPFALVATSLLLVAPPAIQAQEAATVTGVVTDAQDGQPLVGANVLLSAPASTSIAAGTASDADGGFRLSDLTPGTYVLRVRYVGYQEAERPLELAPGDTRTVDVALEQGGFDLNTVVVTASRQAEKALNAPASISVLEARELEREAAPSAVAALRNTPGVDVSQTGIDRRELVLRGFNNAFSGAAYTLTDYRQAAVASLGVNAYTLMPVSSIDLERVEVVRGPGSALYGAGVDAGVIHFFTKGPLAYPGTTIALSGGQREFFSGQLRHAGRLTDRLGYKLVGAYAQGNEWSLDLEDPEDRAQAALSGELVPRDDDYWKYNLAGTLQYMVQEGMTLTTSGGFSAVKSPILSGIGTLQADGFGYAFGQVRLQAGNFFSQVYLNRNDAGDSFVYGRAAPGAPGQPAPLVDTGTLFNAQAQYNFTLAGGREQLIVGADYERTTPDTDGTIVGRNEDDDTIAEVGGYAQATTALTPQFDLLLALRGDYNNVQEEFTLSPRAALVYKPTPWHTLRATYNRAFSSPGTNSNFLDIRAQENDVGSGLRLVFRGRGAADGYTFNTFRDTGAATFSLGVPGFFGVPVPVSNVPLTPIYGAFAAQTAALLQDPDAPEGALPSPFDALEPEQRAALAQLLTGLTASIPLTATTAGTLGIPDASARGFRALQGGPVDIAPLDQETTQTFELGYKGLLGERVLVAVDGYYTRKENFVGPLLVESPLVYLEQLQGDLSGTLAPVLQGAAAADPQVAGFLEALGLDAEAAAALLASLAAGGFAGTPVAVVQPDQPILLEGADDPNTEVGAFLSYRNFGQVAFWGFDAAVEVLATDRLRLFGNVSVVSDDFFDNEELDEENPDLALALNAPSFKAKGGFDYAAPEGFSFGLSGRYVEGFPVQSGPFVGEIDDYFLLDVSAGYALNRYAPGLRLDVTVQNMLDNDHREFIGAPRIGRFALARLTYSFE